MKLAHAALVTLWIIGLLFIGCLMRTAAGSDPDAAFVVGIGFGFIVMVFTVYTSPPRPPLIPVG